MEGKNCVTFAFVKFFSIYLGWVSYFYFPKIIFFITDHAPLILKSFNNMTDITLFLRAHLRETRSELKPVWDFTSGQNFTLVSLLAFTWVQAKWNSLRCKFYFGQIHRSEILNSREFSMYTVSAHSEVKLGRIILVNN